VTAEEIPIVFDCQGESLVGIVHRPAQPLAVGIVTVIAGGPQYRAGVGRNMVDMARHLSAGGVAVLRFDHRGLGDGGGRFLGFEHIGEDLQAAVDALRRTVPELREVVLWGGCDAASGAMIHGWNIKGVTSMVLGNPFVTTEETQAAVLRQHYLRRLGDWSFWRKLLRFEYNPLEYLRAAAGSLAGRLRPEQRGSGESSGSGSTAGAAGSPGNWIARMLEGLSRFEGPVLFLMSGRSIVSREFDDLVSRHRAWQKVVGRSHYERIDILEADQTFSGIGARERVNGALLEWVTRQAAD